MEYHNRNTVWGFSDRVRKNLLFLNAARNGDAEVHVGSELITSLLGLIVFPYAEIKRARYTSFKKYKLNDLSNKGWPNCVFDIGSSEDLHDLVKHLRNAISHRRVHFSSDSRDLEAVEVRFRDRRNDNGPDSWGVTINAAELQKFVLRFADLLKEWERDYL
jgi:hypothetical protein